jgi:hypothetical protein
MTTTADMLTDLANVETEIKAMYSAPDFETGAGTGSRIKVTHSTRLEFLERRARELRMRIMVAGGTVTAEPALLGIDVERSTENGD